MNTALQTFDFEENAVRTVMDERGEIWFVGKDVCQCLDHLMARVDLADIEALPQSGLKLQGDYLVVANAHPALNDIFAGTQWEAGGWLRAFRSLPGAVAGVNPTTFAGVMSRYTMVPINLCNGEKVA